MWWLNFIDNMSEFRITMETHILVYLCACLQKGLTEEGRSTLNMGGTLLQTWVQDWIKTRKVVKDQDSSLPVSWLLIQGDQLIILSPSLLCHDGQHPQRLSQNAPFFPPGISSQQKEKQLT